MRLISLTSSSLSFRAVNFRDGLNIVLAERTAESTRTDSRNGLGKTTYLALVDFCLGARLVNGDRLSQLAGNDWSFTLEFQRRNGQVLRATRSIDEPSTVLVEGDVESAGLAEHDDARDDDSTRTAVGIGRWTTWLGKEAFGPTIDTPGAPSFRSLLRHFLRYQLAAFVRPFASFANPPAAAVQLENAFLLNLDWRLANEWDAIKARQRRLEAIDNPDESSADQIASLEARLVRLRRQSDSLLEQIDSFNVVPEYRTVEADVALTSRQIRDIANENIADRQILDSYQSRLSEEFSNVGPDIDGLFAEVGILLPDAVTRTLEQAREFQRQVAANRSSYLEAELNRLRQRINVRQSEQDELAERQASAMRLLRAGGALEDFAVMQQRATSIQAEISEVESDIETLRELSDRKAALKAEELDLTSRTSIDLRERLSQREYIVSRFGEILEQLYGETADLKASSGKAGFRFQVTLPRSGSSGVEKMAIFAYTVAITEEMSSRATGPGFLAHDSIMYDGVDERQVAVALDLVRQSAERFGYQYLVALNSDIVPWAELADRSEFDAGIILTLTDESPEGGLLGLRVHFQSPVLDEFDGSIGDATDSLQ